MTVRWWKDGGFATQKALRSEIQSIVAAYPDGAQVSSEHFDFMIWVFEHHKRWRTKSSPGVAALTIQPHQTRQGVTRGFWLVRTDGSTEDISWTKCLLLGGGPNVWREVNQAARNEIADQRDAANHSVRYGSPCPICAEPLKDGRHVDHEAPLTFDTLLMAWLAESGILPEQVAVGSDWTFVDRDLAADWQAFHHRHAVLRVIHAHENLSLGNR